MNCELAFSSFDPFLSALTHAMVDAVGQHAEPSLPPDVDTDMADNKQPPGKRALSELPSLLSSVNFDIQSHIMTFLSCAELSALMRTCRYFADVALNPLCSHSKVPLKTVAHVLSFLRFLRLDNPPNSRALLIKELNFCLEEYGAPLTKANYLDVQEFQSSALFALPETHPRIEEHLLYTSRNTALQTFLEILKHCGHIERLYVGRWFEDVPIALLVREVSGLCKLQDLQMPFQRAQFQSNFALASLPLRKLVLSPGRWLESREALTLLSPLSATLVELDVPVCQWVAPGVPFPHVRKLGIEFPASDDVVSDLVRTFPNLTHLFLRGTRNFHLCHTQASRQDENRLRERSQYQWHALTGSWPPLVTVGTETRCALYTLALPFNVQCISVGCSVGDPGDGGMLSTILTDARPACLEMRVRQVHYKFMPLPARFLGLWSGETTSSVQRFILTLEGDGVSDYISMSRLLIDELRQALSSLSVTHLLLKYSIAHFRASRTHTRRVVRTICSEAPVRAALLAQTSKSLRWIGVQVQVQDGPTWLFCWDVSRLSDRAREFGHDAPPSVMLKEMSEDAGWDVLAAEGMEETARAS